MLTRTLGVVMQEPVLFNRSVFKNIKYNCHNVTFEDVENASKMANAFDFINEGKFGKRNNDNK